MTPQDRTRRRLAAVLAVAALGLGGAAFVTSSASAATTWRDYGGNDNGALSCSGDLVKIDSDRSSVVDGITFTSDGTFLSFQSTQDGKAVSFVSVKGGDAYRVYSFDPPATSGSGLRAPTNDGGNIPRISHYTVCVKNVTTTTTTPGTTTPSTTTPSTTTPSTTTPSTTTPSTTTPSTTTPSTTTPSTTTPSTTTPSTTAAPPPPPPSTSPVTVPETTSAPTTVVSPPDETPTTVAPPEDGTATTQAPGTFPQEQAPSTTPLVITRLPETGAGNTTTIVLLAGALMAGGGALLVLTRMRARDHQAG